MESPVVPFDVVVSVRCMVAWNTSLLVGFSSGDVITYTLNSFREILRYKPDHLPVKSIIVGIRVGTFLVVTYQKLVEFTLMDTVVRRKIRLDHPVLEVLKEGDP